ncbi:MAG: GNAT family N-acetyltransferase [Pseudomonadota bacterium]
MGELHYKIADAAAEFDAIHRLNHRTFAEEIPQHPSDASGKLIDRFHGENVYAICLDHGELAGMVAGRCARPFSLDSKVPDLDGQLPPHRKAVEVRLLAVEPAYRHRAVFARLVMQLAQHFRSLGCDLAVISGTVRQLQLYEHMGFRSFGRPVGSSDALYQPMYLTLDAWHRIKVLSSRAEAIQLASFLPGPVATTAAVRMAFCAEPISHRSAQFAECMSRVRLNLCRLTGASQVAVLVGTGTLANDAIAAQVRHLNQQGLVLVNGEFGERLATHARSWDLPHEVERANWGESFDWRQLSRYVRAKRPRWIWAVLSETSTGMTNSASQLRQLCESTGAALCLDAISAIGLMPVDLRGTWLASTVSSKGLGAYAGLAAVFHDGRLAPEGAIPRYVDLAAYAGAGSVPYSHSSNLLAALDCSLESTCWSRKFRRIATMDRDLRARLKRHGLLPLVADEFATPGIITLAMPPGNDATRVALSLLHEGMAFAHESEYLRRRNWLQICLMGDCDSRVVARIPSALAAHISRDEPRDVA